MEHVASKKKQREESKRRIDALKKRTRMPLWRLIERKKRGCLGGLRDTSPKKHPPKRERKSRSREQIGKESRNYKTIKANSLPSSPRQEDVGGGKGGRESHQINVNHGGRGTNVLLHCMHIKDTNNRKDHQR